MDDQTFLTAFEDTTLPPHLFTHQAHIRMAWLYLHEYGWDVGVTKITEGIQRYATAQGANRKYHTTITLFWAKLVYHLLIDSPESSSFDCFLKQYPFILDTAIIMRHYTAEVLRSEQARAEWVEPDLVALPV